MGDLVWVRFFSQTSSERAFFPDIQRCKIISHERYFFSVGIFYARYIFFEITPPPPQKGQMVSP